MTHSGTSRPVLTCMAQVDTLPEQLEPSRESATVRRWLEGQGRAWRGGHKGVRGIVRELLERTGAIVTWKRPWADLSEDQLPGHFMSTHYADTLAIE